MAKTIFVLLDGCGYQTAGENLGYAEHLVEAGQGAKYRVLGELPSSSRPMYETLLTSLPAYVHGIAGNMTARPSRCEHIFGLCRRAGLTTAAAAYSWMCELYLEAPFDPARNRLRFGADAPIQNGIFYFEDGYPDSHVFADAEYLRKTYCPDFLLVHTMSIDAAGHRGTSAGAEYARAAAGAGMMLSLTLPVWLAEGYRVVVAADHGMDGFGLHGGNTPAQRETALYLFADTARKGDRTREAITQLLVAPLLCACLGIAPAPGMRPIAEVSFFEG